MTESDKVFTGSIPQFYDALMVPLIYHDVALIREELTRAGFTDIAIETREKVSRARSAREADTAKARSPARSRRT